MRKPAVRGMPVGNLGTRQAWSDEAQVESARGRDLARVVKSLRVRPMQSRHLGGRPQKRTVRPQMSLRLVQGGAQAGRRQNVAERLLRGRRHARPTRCHQASSARARELREHVPDLVFVPAGPLPFDEHMVAAKRVHESVQYSACGQCAPRSQRAHERAPPAAGEGDKAAAGLAQIDEVVAGFALPGFAQRSLAHGPHEIGVAAGAGCQDGKTHPRIFRPGSESPPRRRRTRNDAPQGIPRERQLSAVHDRQADRAGGHGRLNRRVHTINVENCEGVEPEARSLLHHACGLVGPVEKCEGAVCMQFCVASFHGHPPII